MSVVHSVFPAANERAEPRWYAVLVCLRVRLKLRVLKGIYECKVDILCILIFDHIAELASMEAVAVSTSAHGG